MSIPIQTGRRAVQFFGHSPPEGVKFQRGLFEVRVIGDIWQEAQGWPRSTKDKFNPNAEYRLKP